MKEKTKKNLIDTGLSLGIAAGAGIGIPKAQEWAVTQGKTAEVLMGVGTVGAGVGLCLALEQPLAKAAGVALMTVGVRNAVAALVTDEAGVPKSDKVSQTVAKAVLPAQSLSGWGVNGFGMLEFQNDYQSHEEVIA